jgi:polyisoprenoid-binding protein YceI
MRRSREGGLREMTTQQQTRISTWTIDKTHSNVDFSVKHMLISTVRGSFRDFDATIQIDESDFRNSSVVASIDVASIDTNAADRDAHLRSDDFFNAEAYPRMGFRSRRVEYDGERDLTITGDLTIRDVTREVTLTGEFGGRITDPWGNDRAAFSVGTEVSRKEFNIKWNGLLETGGAVVGDKVKIHLYIEATRHA